MMRNPLRILITGAGGLLGSELSGTLADRGHAVVALLYRRMAMHRNDGRPLSVRPWNGDFPPPDEISALRGDVRQPGLGLDRTSLAEIVRGLDLVIHGAAATGFNLSEGVYQEVNIGGTANALTVAPALAQRGGMGVGFHGGMMGGGGFHGGMMGGGGFHGGMMGGGGFHGGMMGGFHNGFFHPGFHHGFFRPGFHNGFFRPGFRGGWWGWGPGWGWRQPVNWWGWGPGRGWGPGWGWRPPVGWWGWR